MEAAAEALLLTAITIAIVGALFHLTGLCLLLSLKRSRMSSTQRWYLLNISLTELLLCAGGAISALILLRDKSGRVVATRGFFVYQVVLQIVLPAMWYMLMLTLTIDRFLAIFLSFKYPIYWHARRAHKLSIVQWITSLLLGTTVAVLKFAADIKIVATDLLQTIRVALDWLLVTTVIVVYGYIFIKYQKSVKIGLSTRNIISSAPTPHNAQTLLSIFRGSKFWVPTLILTSFMLCIATPNLVIYFYLYTKLGGRTAQTVVSLMFVLLCTESSIDAMIYILLSPSVRSLLMEKLHAVTTKMTCQKEVLPSQVSASSHVRKQTSSGEGTNP